MLGLRYDVGSVNRTSRTSPGPWRRSNTLPASTSALGGAGWGIDGPGVLCGLLGVRPRFLSVRIIIAPDDSREVDADREPRYLAGEKSKPGHARVTMRAGTGSGRARVAVPESGFGRTFCSQVNRPKLRKNRCFRENGKTRAGVSADYVQYTHPGRTSGGTGAPVRARVGGHGRRGLVDAG